MKYMKATPASIHEAATAIRNGDIVAFPTETVYGLGADAFNAVACAKIFEAKQRPQFDPLIVHVENAEQVRRVCSSIPPQAKVLIQKFWPGPLTLVLPKSPEIPSLVTAGLDTVAVRMPSHPIAHALIKDAGTPIAAPSANPFGYLSPTTGEHVKSQLGDRVSIILDGGPCPIGVESTILKIGNPPILLRPGGLPLEDIEQEIGTVTIGVSTSSNPDAPGLLKTHYSPRTPLVIIHGPTLVSTKRKVGYLAFTAPPPSLDVAMVEILSRKGNLREAAANLFSCLHRLDEASLDIIYAEAVPEEGLGRAIMNRLQKAACK